MGNKTCVTAGVWYEFTRDGASDAEPVSKEVLSMVLVWCSTLIWGGKICVLMQSLLAVNCTESCGRPTISRQTANEVQYT